MNNARGGILPKRYSRERAGRRERTVREPFDICRLFYNGKNNTALEAGRRPGIGYAKTCGNSPEDFQGRSTGSEVDIGKCVGSRTEDLASTSEKDVQYTLLLK